MRLRGCDVFDLRGALGDWSSLLVLDYGSDDREMSLRRKYLLDAMRQIKEAIGMDQQPDFDSKDIYLKKGDDVVGLHTFGDNTECGFMQMEAWANAYDLKFKFLGSIYRIFGPIEDEAAEMKKDGWVEVEAPAQKCQKCDKPAEAKRYKFCYDCWWAQDPRSKS